MWVLEDLHTPLVNLECILKVLVILDKMNTRYYRLNPIAPERKDIQNSFLEFLHFDLKCMHFFYLHFILLFFLIIYIPIFQCLCEIIEISFSDG